MSETGPAREARDGRFQCSDISTRWRERQISTASCNAKSSSPRGDADWLTAYLTLPDHLSSDMQERLRQSDVFVAELLAADLLAVRTLVSNDNVPWRTARPPSARTRRAWCGGTPRLLEHEVVVDR
jgi:hypothetical protein